MMMETVVYAREFLYIKELYEKGALGKIQSDAVHLLDRAAWINPDQRGEVLDELAKLVVLAKARTAADEFLAALNDASSSVRSTFGVSSRRG